MSHLRPTFRRLVRTALLALALVVGLPWAPGPVLALEVPTPLAPLGDPTPTIEPAESTPLAIPEFRWSAVEGAKTYRLQVSRDNFATLALNVTTANTAYTPLQSSALPDGDWAWRVRAESPSPAGDYSPTAYFSKRWAVDANKPVLLDPPHDPDGLTPLAFFEATTFSWEPVLGAASYRVQIAASPEGFGSPLFNVVTLATTLQPTAKRANGMYFWRVIPLDPNDREGIASDVRAFKVDYNLAPIPIAPADDDTPAFTPTFRWEAVGGAEYYTLQYSTDPTFNAGVTSLTTRNTAYTPVDDLPNDVNFYWRVRAHSGASVGPWSHPAGEEWSFVKKWYLPPTLLTPTSGFQHVDKPFFSWTPVPGARRYKFELNNVPVFPPTGPGAYTAYTANPFFHVPVGKKALTPGIDWFWRVIPLDANNNAGQASGVFSFRTSLVPAPMLIGPLYYYTPNEHGAGAEMFPHEDRTVALPIFSWHRALGPGGQAAAYRIEVSESDAVDPDGTLTHVLWTADTENLFSTPTVDNPFAPAEGTDYFWHVAVLDGAGGSLASPWSELWRARFAPSAALDPGGAGTAPQLLRPAQGSEWTEATPLFEWRPVEGAEAYDVEICTAPGYAEASRVDLARVPYPAYAPTARMAYEGDGATALPYGTYYWRVRAVSGGVPGDWTAEHPAPDGDEPVPPARFQVASQSRWRSARTEGDAANRVVIATDPAADAAAGYDLTTLHAVQSANDWYFGWHVAADGGADYVLYLDLDHVEGSGGATDPLGNPVSATGAHLPEYVIVVEGAAAPVASNTWIYRWTGSAWATRQNLASLGGGLAFADGYLEIRVRGTDIGMEDRTGSASLALYSAPAAGGAPLDTVPPAADLGTLSRFSSVSDRLMLVSPANLRREASEGVQHPTVPPFFWQPPVDVDCYGYYVQAARDEGFTAPVLDFSFRTKDLPGFEPPFLPYEDDLDGDNTYYWRVRAFYTTSDVLKSAWSEPFVLDREGLAPENLQASVTFATPTFSWDRVEGASGYDLQVSTDPAFGTTQISVNDLARNTYTWVNTLANATYHWRVRIRREGGILNDWSQPEPGADPPVGVFTLSLPTPASLEALPSATRGAPTLCWDPLVAVDGEDTPVLAAWKYRVQVSRDPTFSTIWDNVDTEQACWTPTKGYYDGAHWWRVAMIDGQGKVGDYAAAEFTKTYPLPQPVSPAPGAVSEATPTFAWAPVDGAASYRIEVSTTPGFNAIYDSATTNNVVFSPTKVYEGNTTYYWRVAMIDRNNCAGSAEVQAVIVDPDPGPVPLENPVWLPMLSGGSPQ